MKLVILALVMSATEARHHHHHIRDLVALNTIAPFGYNPASQGPYS